MTVTLGTVYAADSTGWTTITYPGDANVYYVDPAGSDTNNGILVAHGGTGAWATCAHAITQINAMSSGVARWLLLKEGAVFNGGGTGDGFGTCSISGAGDGTGSGDPFVIGSFDPATPTVLSPGTGGAAPLVCHSGTSNADCLKITGDYVAVINIELYCSDRDPANTATHAPFYTPSAIYHDLNGISIWVAFNWILIEGVAISFFPSTNLLTETGGSKKLRLRRCVMTDCYRANSNNVTGAGHAEGIYLQTVADFHPEECIFDRNGWNATLATYQTVSFTNGSATVTFPAGTTQTNALLNNITIRLAGTPPTPFTATTYTALNVSGNTCQLSTDGVTAVTATAAGSCTAQIADFERNGFNHNIYVAGFEPDFASGGTHDQTSLSPTTCLGCMFFNDPSGNQFRSGGTIDNNLFVVNSYSFAFGAPIIGSVNYAKNNVSLSNRSLADYALGDVGSPYNGDNYNNATIEFISNITANPQGNITSTITIDSNYSGTIFDSNVDYSCGSTILNNAGASSTLTNNKSDINGNTFPDPTNGTTSAYYASIGNPHGFASSDDGFISACRLQRKNNWDSRLTAHDANNFVRGKFGVTIYPITSRSAHGKGLKYGF